MRRRQLIRCAGGVFGVVSGSSVVGASGDADPRPVALAGTRPSGRMPTVSTGALPQERSSLPVGHWIQHLNGWASLDRDAEELKAFAERTTQTYIIDGEAFVLDGLDDWEYFVDSDGIPRLRFEYVTPPKRKGKTYEIRWELEGADIDAFPFTNEVTVVGRD